MPDRFPSNRGYFLVESMVAVTIVIVGLLGVFALLSRSLSLNRVVSDRYTAAALAGEGIEIVKNIIDNNVLAGRPWNDGLAAGRYQVDVTADRLGTPCGAACTRVFYFDPTAKLYRYAPGGRKTNFNRVIVIRPAADQEGLVQALRINAEVSWLTRGRGQFTVNVEDHFYNYR